MLTSQEAQRLENPTLQLTPVQIDSDQYRVEVRLLDRGDMYERVEVHLTLTFSSELQERLRWYLEDYLQYPLGPASSIASSVEQQMREIGLTLFKGVFGANSPAHHIWTTVLPHLQRARIEIVEEQEETAVFPWELLLESEQSLPVALCTRAFIRIPPSATHQDFHEAAITRPVRILLAICRPAGNTDLPFLSVANRVVQSLRGWKAFQLEVIRPPTFERLVHRIQAAHEEGYPYSVVHFDGHGEYISAKQMEQYAGLPDRRGYLLFEDNQRRKVHINGERLGKELVKANVPLLILNACRSAHTEVSAEPGKAISDTEARSFGSFAHEAIREGLLGVVAMRYDVYVDTAAQCMTGLYEALTQGKTLGEAVTQARKHLYAHPQRQVGLDTLSLQDWMVPTVYEAAPVPLIQPPTLSSPPDIPAFQPERDSIIPPSPHHGFIGRDAIIHTLDRLFQNSTLVLLYGLLGSGKTSAAVEFARWYQQTGGVESRSIIITSFARLTSLEQVLDSLLDVFHTDQSHNEHNLIPQDGIHKEQIILGKLREMPVLWIWDNVEFVGGFPTRNYSEWSDKEQKKLLAFLLAAKATGTKFLLTSCRDERSWLGDHPIRIMIPPMLLRERELLMLALVRQHEQSIAHSLHWRSLLLYSEGNPLILQAVVDSVLRNGLTTEEHINDFVFKLRMGEVPLDDEMSNEHPFSVTTRLYEGLQQMFTENEQRKLAPLQFFQGFVDIQAFSSLAMHQPPQSLSEWSDTTTEECVALFDRLADIGLLGASQEDRSKGLFTLHPALPWLFRQLIEQFYPGSKEHIASAYVKAIGNKGYEYHTRYEQGQRHLLRLLAREEGNLLYAHQLARHYGWLEGSLSTLEGLDMLYSPTVRRAEWIALVRASIPLESTFENHGILMAEEHMLVAMAEHDFLKAERLQRGQVRRAEQLATPVLANPVDSPLDEERQKDLILLSTALSQLAIVLFEQGKKGEECFALFRRAFDISQKTQDHTTLAISAHNLSCAHLQIPTKRDIQQAEHYSQYALDHIVPGDRVGRGKCLYLAGRIAIEKYIQIRKSRKASPSQETSSPDLLKAAEENLENALLYVQDIGDKAIIYTQLGNIFLLKKTYDQAVYHYQQALRLFTDAGHLLGMGTSYRYLSVIYYQMTRFEDARVYAKEALATFTQLDHPGIAKYINPTRSWLLYVNLMAKTVDVIAGTSKKLSSLFRPKD